MTTAQQVQESAERIAKLEMQQREIQWNIVREQRNFERLRTLERFETERSILAAKANGENLGEQARKSSDSGDSHAERSPVSPNADVVAFPGGRWT